MQSYVEEFRWLQMLVRDWSEEVLMGAFLEGLKPWLARKLKLKQPRHLQEAMKMVEILEDSYYAEKRQGKDGQVRKSFKAP